MSELEAVGSGVVGAIVFPSLLAASQAVLLKPLRVSFSPSLLSSLLGLGSVSMASCGASFAALKTISLIQDYYPGSKSKPRPSGDSGAGGGGDLLLSTVGGVVMFRALGGRFGAALPSNLMRPGVFGLEWLPALRGSQLASQTERALVRDFGGRNGCHTCGRRRRGVEFVADHQPPSKVVGNHRGGGGGNGGGGGGGEGDDQLLQRFYAQCVQCSRIQGGLLGGGSSISSAFSHPKAIKTHVTSLRAYHLFLPLPFGIWLWNSTPTPSPPPPLITPPQAVATQPDQSDRSVQASPDPIVADMALLNTSISRLVSTFPPLLLWHKLIHFLTAFKNPIDTFHVTLWAFGIIAALGTI